ncbi:MAG: phospholipase D-like domain-containing protein [Planctomycetota bacterium]
MPKLLLQVVLGFAACGCAFGQPTLQLLESAPTETTLDRQDIPATERVWAELIDNAKQSIDLAHFYASNQPGSRLEPVIQALQRAATRGVRIRFLADEKFYGTYPDTLDRLSAVDHTEVRRIDLRPITGGVMHAKYLIVDGQKACVGSANFDWRALEHIQELGALIAAEPVAQAFAEVFKDDWRRAAGGGATEAAAPQTAAPQTGGAGPPPQDATFRGEPVRVTPVFSPRALLPAGLAWDLPRILEAIRAAERRVYVQVLSYRTGDRNGGAFDEIDSALRDAARRGVDVRLMVADWSKRPSSAAELQRLQAEPRIEVRFLCIPPAQHGFIPFARVAHAKYMVVDADVAWLGTSNWGRDYFYASRNAGLIVEGSSFGARLEQFFLTNWESSYAEVVDLARQYTAPAVAEAPPTDAATLDANGRWPRPTQLYQIARVVDGDTVHVRREGRTVKLRLLSVDTEEKRGPGGASSPTKPKTRYGDETTVWAQEFFAGCPGVGLRFPGGVEELDAYGRLLCHVVLEDGTDFNLLLVREGRSPYFDKYGHSRLCHDAFVVAQQRAREALQGIWNPKTNAATGDDAAVRRPYGQLLPWWGARAEAIAEFRSKQAEDPETHIDTEDPTALAAALERGHRVELFGTIRRLADGDEGELRVVFRANRGDPPVIAIVPPQRRAGIEALALDRTTHEMQQNYVWLRGKLTPGERCYTVAAGDVEQWRIASPAYP